MQALESSRNHYLDLFVNAPVSLLALDEKGRISRLNHAAAAMLGDTARQLADRAFDGFVASADLPHWHGHLRRAKESHGVETTDVRLLIDGKVTTVNASTTHMADDGSTTMTAFSVVTVSSRVRKLRKLMDRTLGSFGSDVSTKGIWAALPPIVVPVLGDFCVAELCDESGRTIHIASAHEAPEIDRALRASAADVMRLPGMRWMVERAATSALPQGSPTFGVIPDDAPSAVAAQWARDLEQVGLKHAVIVPVSGRGPGTGSVLIGATALRPPFEDADVSAGMELARRASLALVNARGSPSRLAAASVKAQPAEELGSSEKAPHRILLVEDNDDLRDVTTTLLGKLSYYVQPARSLEEARSKMRADKYDVLISDLRLPDGSGLDLMRELRAEESKIKGIALSGYDNPDDLEEAEGAGFAVHMKKPVTFSELRAALLRIL